MIIPLQFLAMLKVYLCYLSRFVELRMKQSRGFVELRMKNQWQSETIKGNQI